jgi:hypothetical protein
MPIYRHALDALTLDDVPSLDLDRGAAKVDLVRVGFVDGVRGLGGAVWIRSGLASRRITRSRAVTVGVSRLQGTIVGARLPCRPGR